MAKGNEIVKENPQGDVVLYQTEDGTTTYVEEVRVGRKELAMDTIYKRKNGKLTDAKK